MTRRPTTKNQGPRTLRALLALLPLLLLPACPTTPQPPAPPTGGLRCEGTPPNALVTVDEQIAGTIEQLGELPVMLQPGTHRVQAAAPGFFPWYGDVEVGVTVESLHVELRAVPE
ncbi:MAG: PEGA domain-containing protein [Deltaproteobacteria bacterium]|nr:PEGA domain-containing protein [Deltaproteobacteria bacterium]